jgi:hypothetical protein
MKEEKIFDSVIKTALEQVEVPYDPATWDLLEQKLNAAFPVEEQHPIDQIVGNKLENMQVPYEPANWNLLSNQMDAVRKTELRIRYSKLLEAAIFLLLLVSIDGLSGLFWEAAPFHRHQQDQVPIADNEVVPATAGKKHGLHTVAGIQGVTNPLKVFAAVFGGSNSNTAEPQPQKALATQPTSVNLEDGQAALINPIVQVNLTKFETVDPVASLNPALLPTQVTTPGFPHQIIVKAPAPQRRYYVALSSGLDKNYIRSDNNLRTGTGYNIAAIAGVKSNNWGFETGLVYAKKQYVPKKSIEIYDHNTQGFLGTYASNVTADIVSIPVKAMRRLVNAGKTGVYAVAGVTGHVAMHKNYQYNQVFYPAPSQLPNPGPASTPHLVANARGLLQKGNLRDNAYVTVDTGLRLERAVGKRVSVFVEPIFQTCVGRAVNIGPAPSKINTLSISAGVMASL